MYVPTEKEVIVSNTCPYAPDDHGITFYGTSTYNLPAGELKGVKSYKAVLYVQLPYDIAGIAAEDYVRRETFDEIVFVCTCDLSKYIAEGYAKKIDLYSFLSNERPDLLARSYSRLLRLAEKEPPKKKQIAVDWLRSTPLDFIALDKSFDCSMFVPLERNKELGVVAIMDKITEPCFVHGVTLEVDIYRIEIRDEWHDPMFKYFESEEKAKRELNRLRAIQPIDPEIDLFRRGYKYHDED